MEQEAKVSRRNKKVEILDSRMLTGHFGLLKTNNIGIQLVQNASQGRGTVAGSLACQPLQGTPDPIDVPAYHAQHFGKLSRFTKQA